jgi:crotonobetainyl-CoA:carnitine CoA-transferase CaiB-like acyl-CoA transferase
LPPDDAVPTGLPLAGIRVADFSRVLAGPLATMLLGDLGADVVKVERPVTGDDTRGWGPPFVGGDAAYFLSLNRNKRSVTLDLATEDGRGAARRLALASDVVVENFRPGLMERFGLDHASLSAEHPGLVYCSLTAFGEGDQTARPGYDIIVQALSGLMSFTGHPGGEPTKVGVALLDVICGLYACNAIQAALLGRNATGRGSRVSVSLFDASVAALVNQAANYLLGGLVPRPLGNAHPNIVPYQLFEAADRPFILAAGNDRLFERTCGVIGRPELASDERPWDETAEQVVRGLVDERGDARVEQ